MVNKLKDINRQGIQSSAVTWFAQFIFPKIAQLIHIKIARFRILSWKENSFPFRKEKRIIQNRKERPTNIPERSYEKMKCHWKNQKNPENRKVYWLPGNYLGQNEVQWKGPKKAKNDCRSVAKAQGKIKKDDTTFRNDKRDGLDCKEKTNI